MFDTTEMGIKEIISRGESQTVEFKERLPSDYILAKVLVAFANTTDEGIILIGVEDNNEIIGLTKKEALVAVDKLRRISTTLGLQIETGTRNINGRIIVFAVIEKPPKFRLPLTTSRGEVYIRKGAATGLVSLEEVTLPLVRGREMRKIRGFVAMSFREEEDPTLVDYFEAMERAADKTKLPISLTKIDLEEGDFEISQKIMDEISKSDFVLADFTLSPRNVYFETGYARGCGKFVLQTARLDTKLEFDVRNWKTIFYKNATELEKRLIPAFKEMYKRVLKE